MSECLAPSQQTKTKEEGASVEKLRRGGGAVWWQQKEENKKYEMKVIKKERENLSETKSGEV